MPAAATEVGRIALLVYDGFQLLDAAGPAAVFAAANDVVNRRVYEVLIVSAGGGAVASSSGVTLHSRPCARVPAATVNTLLISGGEKAPLRAVIGDALVRRWVTRCAAAAPRFGSVCSGAFVLAALGLLHGKRVATHWAGCEALATMFPAVTVDPDALYVNDGRIWTSAGVTTGIDMSLALVEQDVGAAVANTIARRLVLYARRPGTQSQFSPLLRAQVQAQEPLAGLIEWMQQHLAEQLDVPVLARRAGLSERSFYRRFVTATGQTPAHFVESLRLDSARALLARGLTVKAIAEQVGLCPAARLSSAFERRFGMTPTLYRRMHSPGAREP